MPLPQLHSPMPNLDTYLFDLDGTLLDSLELILDSYRHTLNVHRGSAPPDEVWIAGVGIALLEQDRSLWFWNSPELAAPIIVALVIMVSVKLIDQRMMKQNGL